MHFPRYWTTARSKRLSAWGWSDISTEHAASCATERLTRIQNWLKRGGELSSLRAYGYPNRPMREEVLQEFRSSDGTLCGVVTRNSYGCRVLNTSNLMFVDVDAPEAKESGWLAGLFGFRKPDHKRNPDAFGTELMARIKDWVQQHPDWGWRVYRTAAGYRLMATHQPCSSDAIACKPVFDFFRADPLYQTLCAAQKCFRARLTPKPWRCGVEKLRVRWPWGNAKSEECFRKWETDYRKAAARHATCKLAGHFGNTTIHPELQELVSFHDAAVDLETNLPLA